MSIACCPRMTSTDDGGLRVAVSIKVRPLTCSLPLYFGSSILNQAGFLRHKVSNARARTRACARARARARMHVRTHASTSEVGGPTQPGNFPGSARDWFGTPCFGISASASPGRFALELALLKAKVKSESKSKSKK